MFLSWCVINKERNARIGLSINELPLDNFVDRIDQVKKRSGRPFFFGLILQLVPLEELDEDMSIMGGREVVLEHRTLFR